MELLADIPRRTVTVFQVLANLANEATSNITKQAGIEVFGSIALTAMRRLSSNATLAMAIACRLTKHLPDKTCRAFNVPRQLSRCKNRQRRKQQMEMLRRTTPDFAFANLRQQAN